MFEYVAQRFMPIQEHGKIVEYKPGDVIREFEKWDYIVQRAHLNNETVIRRAVEEKPKKQKARS